MGVVCRLVAVLASLCAFFSVGSVQAQTGPGAHDRTGSASVAADGTILLARARPILRPPPGRPGFGRPNLSRPGIGRPNAGRPIARPDMPAFSRPNRPSRPGNANVGNRPTGAVVRPDGSSAIIRPPVGNRPKPPGVRPPGVRPPGIRPPGFRPGWRPWRPGLRRVIITAPSSYATAEELNWCHVHRYRVSGMRFHRDVRCHQHADWNHRSIRYVYGN
jgi:hypothetical protein